MAALRLANVFVEDALGLPEGVFTLAVYTGGQRDSPPGKRVASTVNRRRDETK
ncbi:MAG TPA: hypothetical protein VF278_09465 [Pirellulales bacterium]